jgi:hypothetical protein
MTAELRQLLEQRSTIPAGQTPHHEVRLAGVRRRVSRLRWRRRALGIGAALAVVVIAVAGYVAGPSRTALAPPGGSVPDDYSRQLVQAQDELDRWERAVSAAAGWQSFIPIGELTGQIGNWELAVGSNNKAALMAGRVVAAASPLTQPAPPNGEVRWGDGTSLTLPTVSAATALESLIASATGTCAECVPLQVTGATLSSGQIQTNRGPATVPIWEFTLQGTAVRVTRPAVDASVGVSVTPPPWNSADPPAGLTIENASHPIAGLDLTVHFIGASSDSGPCGADYTAEAVESAHAVVVIVIEHRHDGQAMCNAMGYPRTAVAHLTRPLGERAVLEVRQGLPVPVTITQ